MSYLLWLAIFFGIPLIVVLIINNKLLFIYKKIFIKTVIGSLIFSIPWDIISVKTNIWYFPGNTLGWKIFDLPVEEFIFIPMAAIVVTYITLILGKKYGIRS